ncbi:MAG: DUF2924 domain-containing protein [Phycisphaerales bacterium]|nr:DUF2924 domain-containing protein [Phycisphaerales bacterium]
MSVTDQSIDVPALLADLKRLGVSELRDRYEQLTGERCSSGNRDWLTKRVVWLEQARLEGGLPERARRRALEIADDRDLRFRPPTTVTRQIARADTPTIQDRDPRLPMPGAEIVRVYKGARIVVRVLPEGFEWGGKRYRSLTSIATAVTGTTWNGFHFFGLNKKGGERGGGDG